MKDLTRHILNLRIKSSRKIIGVMSGTSVDGITIALSEISGTGVDASISLIAHKTYLFEPSFRERVFRLFNPEQSKVKDVCEINYSLGSFLGVAINLFISEYGLNGEDIDLIGSHGQTIWHQPIPSFEKYGSPSTLKIGEPAAISEKTGYPVVADFRKADMALGGQGAPLTPYLDYVLHKDPNEGRIFQNIGGIANLTYVPSGASKKEIVVFDTGPGNMIIDSIIFKNTGSSFDFNGEIAKKGKVDQILLTEFLENPYYKIKPPKTTGRELFGEQYTCHIIERAKELSINFEDLVATVTKLTIETILSSYRMLPREIDAVYVSGGGSKNPVIMEGLRNGLDIPVFDYSTLGYPSEAKEALLMALLANEYVMGTPSNVIKATGAKREAVLGYCTWI